MAIFKITAVNSQDDYKTIFFDNMTSTLTWEDGTEIYDEYINNTFKDIKWNTAKVTTPDNPLGKSSNIRKLKIQLGLSCNYSCEYCSQRFIPHADETNSKYVDGFVNNLDSWMTSIPEEIEFWGGEPLVYIKTIKPLAEKLREKFPYTKFIMITNGSLLTREINEWIEKIDFSIGISHDGPGQPVRGPDPLNDADKRDNILDLFKRLNPKGNISFNSMMNRENMDRAAIQHYFDKLTQSNGIETYRIGEGGFIDPYDEGGLKNMMRDDEEHYAYRRLTLFQTRNKENMKFNAVYNRMLEYFNAISAKQPATSIGQKCGMDDVNTIAVDLRGNVLTCHNTSYVSKAPNGNSHKIGHVSNLDKVKLNTSTHWSARNECSNCPVLVTCKGACMYLMDDLWDKACINAYSDHIPFFALAIEILTGYLPVYIEHEALSDIRKDIWGPKDINISIPKTRSNVTSLNHDLINLE